MLKFFTLRKSNVITAVNHQNYLFKPSFHVFHISVNHCEVKDKKQTGDPRSFNVLSIDKGGHFL